MHYDAIHATTQYAKSNRKYQHELLTHRNTKLKEIPQVCLFSGFTRYNRLIVLWISVLWVPSASFVGLMWRVQGPYESIGGWRITQQYVWRSVSDLETVQRTCCQCPLLCPDYFWLQQFPASLQTKEYLWSVLHPLSPFILIFLYDFTFVKLLCFQHHLNKLQKKLDTRMAQNPFIYVLPHLCPSNTLECLHGCVSLFEHVEQPELLS